MEEVAKWLSETTGSRYILLEYGGKFTAKSKFLDTQRNKEFICEFTVFKRNIKRNPNTIFAPTREEIKEANENKALKKWGVKHYSQTEEFKKRSEEAHIKKSGFKNVMQSKEFREKQELKMLQNHGVRKPLQNPEIKKRQEEETMNRHGSISPMQKGKLRDKFIGTMLRDHGFIFPAQKPENRKKFSEKNPRLDPVVDEKIKQTNLDKRGVEHVFQSEEVKEKIHKVRIEKGLTKFYNNKTIKEWAEQTGFSRTHFNLLVNRLGFEFAIKCIRKESSLETVMKQFLDEINVPYIQDKKLTNSSYRPDFIIDDHKLIIECNGLYWHSDQLIKDKKYHIKKKQNYSDLQYNSLFFNEDELLNKFNIVKSIITNKLKLCKKVYARKCVVAPEGPPEFFEQNHLMGKGTGRIFSLKYNGEIISAAQVAWKDKHNKILEISRFAPKLNYNVIGGFSKLISYIITTEKPNIVQTFIDKRYGDGSYLKNLGWKFVNEDISFKWINGFETFHRLTFPSNSGYEYGMAKLWDCGQAKWQLNVNKI